MKRLIFILTLILASVFVFGQTANDQNYKLGNFKDSQVKAKSVNIGGSWTVQKNSTSKALDFYYGATKVYAVSTTGEVTLKAISGTTTPTTSTLTANTIALWKNTTSGEVYLVANVADTIRTVNLAHE